MSPKKKSTGITTREQIREAALRMFGEKSYLGATTAEIAAEAGVSEKTIFDLFGDKKSLYLEVRENITDKMLLDVIRELPFGAGAPKVLRAIGREFLRQTRENLDRVRVSIQAITAIEDPDIKKDAQDIFLRFHDLVEKTLIEGQEAGTVREDIDVHDFAWAYSVALYSTGYVELMGSGEPLDEDRAMFILDRFIDLMEVSGRRS